MINTVETHTLEKGVLLGCNVTSYLILSSLSTHDKMAHPTDHVNFSLWSAMLASHRLLTLSVNLPSLCQKHHRHDSPSGNVEITLSCYSMHLSAVGSCSCCMNGFALSLLCCCTVRTYSLSRSQRVKYEI